MKQMLANIAQIIDFVPDKATGIITAYQCNNQSNLRPERFLIYYGLFRHNDKNPTPDLVAKWNIILKNSERDRAER